MLPMVSDEESFDIPKPKPFATRCWRYHGGALKFQLKHHAIVSLDSCISDRTYPSEEREVQFHKKVVVYKLINDKYVRVFDSDSDMAKMYMAGAYTRDQLFARIFE